jgi:hypothetical protein
MVGTFVTPAHREILQLVRSFNGLYGPLAIEAAMKALSRCKPDEWSPIINHLELLTSEGLVHCDESNGPPRFRLTKEGERVLGK